MDKEDALAFAKASSKAIELAVHKCSNGDNISARGLAALLESLDCSDSCPILDQFKTGENYNTQKVHVFLQVVTKGNVLDKSSAIWDMFDKTFENTLAKARVTEMFKVVVGSAVAYGSDQITSTLHQQYLNKLKERVGTLADEYTKSLLGDNTQISKAEFLHKVRNDSDVPNMLIARHIRAKLETTKYIPNKLSIDAAFANFSI